MDGTSLWFNPDAAGLPSVQSGLGRVVDTEGKTYDKTRRADPACCRYLCFCFVCASQRREWESSQNLGLSVACVRVHPSLPPSEFFNASWSRRQGQNFYPSFHRPPLSVLELHPSAWSTCLLAF